MPRKPEVVDVMQAFKAALRAREDAQLRMMASRWLSIEASVNERVLLLARELEAAKLANSIITEQLLWDMERYKALQAQVKKEITKFVDDVAVGSIEAEQLHFGEIGITGAQAAINAQVKLAFHKLPFSAVETYVGLAGDGSPLKKLLMEAYPDSVDGIVKAFIEGTARGINPVQVAKEVAKGMGMGLDRITLIARTEQLRVWRTTSVQQYRESGVVKGFKRLATKDDRTCMACLVADGEIFTLESELTDHPRGRCTTVPLVIDAPEIEWEKGKDWFLNQPPSVQEQMMGPAMYKAWKENGFPLEALKSIRTNAVWGDSPVTTPLTQLLKAYGGLDKNDPLYPQKLAAKKERARLRRLKKKEGATLTTVDDGQWPNKPRFHWRSADLSSRREQMLNYYKELLPGQKTIFKEYTGSGYRWMNAFLRQGKVVPGTPFTREELSHLRQVILDAFEKHPALGDELTVFRGINSKNVLEKFRGLRVGSVFTDEGLISTTLSSEFAENWGGWGSLVFRIRARPGATVIHPWSLHKTEAEVLLPPGQKFKILKMVPRKGGGLFVEVETIP